MRGAAFLIVMLGTILAHWIFSAAVTPAEASEDGSAAAVSPQGLDFDLSQLKELTANLGLWFGQPNGDHPRGEMFSGLIVSRDLWTGWAGAVWSFKHGLYEPGWRLRVVGAYGSYTYDMGRRRNQAHPALVEITPGYQFRKGPLIAKFYAGFHAEQHQLAYPDAGNSAAAMRYGVRLLSENWLDLPHASFVNADFGYSTLNKSYNAQVRVGSAKLISRLQAGPEAAINGNVEHYQMRAGGFLRWSFGGGTLEGSGGLVVNDDRRTWPYAGVSVLHRF